ncbi:MAG: T9SS type A sorting domain-containing protein, partial [Bacteroidota bacterium]
SLELVEENNVGKVFLEIQNFSNLPVELTEAELTLENQFSVTEQIDAFIGIEESQIVSLNIGIPLSVSEPSYFCVKLNSQYTDFPDINAIDNEKCLTIEPEVQVESPFPNPVTDRFRLKVVVPRSSEARITLLDSSGKIRTEQKFTTEAGLNNFFIETTGLDSGIYYVTIEIQGETYRRKVIKL